MKAPITTAQAMSYPDVVLTINTLVKMADDLRAALQERDAEIGKLHAAMADLQDLESNARQKCDHWFERYQAKDAVIAAQRKVLEQAKTAATDAYFHNDNNSLVPAITAIQGVLK